MSDSDEGVLQIDLDRPDKSPTNSRDFKEKRLAGSVKVVETDEEIEFRKYYNGVNVIRTFPDLIKCTKCMHSFKSAIFEGKKIHTHPILQVLMCETCCSFYGNGEFSLDEDDEDKYCRWCGEGGKIFLCSECICGFCPTCIKKHFGKQKVREIERDDEWVCFICNPKPLWKLRAICRLAVEQSMINKTKNDALECETPKKKFLNLRNSRQNTLAEGASSETVRIKGSPNNEDSSASSRDAQRDFSKLSRSKRKRFHTSNCQGKEAKTSGNDQSDDGEEPPKRTRSGSVKSTDNAGPGQSTHESMAEATTISSSSSDSSSDDEENEVTVTLDEADAGETSAASRAKNKSLEKLKNIFTVTESVSELCLKMCRKKIKKLDRNSISDEKLLAECEKLRSMIILMSCSLSTAHNMIASLQKKRKMKEQSDLPFPGKQDSTLLEAFGKILREKKMKSSSFFDVVSDILKKYPFIELGAESFSNYIKNVVCMDSALELINNCTGGEGAENSIPDDTTGHDPNTTEGSSERVTCDTEPRTNPIQPDDGQSAPRNDGQGAPRNDGQSAPRNDEPPRQPTNALANDAVILTPSPSNESASPSPNELKRRSQMLKDDFLMSSDEVSAEDEQVQASNSSRVGRESTVIRRAKGGMLVDNEIWSEEDKEIARLMNLSSLERNRKRASSDIGPIERGFSKDEEVDERHSWSAGCDPLAAHAKDYESESHIGSDFPGEWCFSDSQVDPDVPMEDSTCSDSDLDSDEIEGDTPFGYLSFNPIHPSIIQRNIENEHVSMAKGYFLQTSSSNEGLDDSSSDEKTETVKPPVKSSVIVERRPVAKKEKSDWRSDSLLRCSLSLPEPKNNDRAAEPTGRSTRKSNNEEEGTDSDSTSCSSDFDSHIRRKRKVTTLSSSPDSDIEELVVPPKSNVESPPKGRRNIKKIVKTGNLQLETRQAVKAENERKKRIAERKKIYEELFPNMLTSERLVLDFDPETKEVLLEVPKEIAKVLKPHQKEGIKFMWDCCFESLDSLEKTNGSGCVLAHCMGLGKTLQVISLILTIMKNGIGIKTILILCPMNVVNNWMEEFAFWLKDSDFKIDPCNLYNIKGENEKVSYLKNWQKEGGVTIVSYDLIRSLTNPKKKSKTSAAKAPRFSELLINPGPDLVICDEGHLLKNQGTALSKCITKINTSRRIILTGTPLQNNLIEYHSMVEFIKPNILGTRKEFMNRFGNPIINGQFEDSTENDVKLMRARSHVLHKLLEGCIQRQSYSVLTPYLPEKYEYVLSIRLTEPQDKLYRHYLGTCKRTFISNKAAKLFNDFHLLQRIWTHPRLMVSYIENEDNIDYDFDETRLNPQSSEDSIICLDTDDGSSESSVVRVKEFVKTDLLGDIQTSGKLVMLLNILTGCRKVGDKVLVFSQSLRNLNLIEYFLHKINSAHESASPDLPPQFRDTWVKGVDYYRMEGSTSNETRTKWCKNFNNMKNKRLRLFLISTKAGGLGINLIGANRVVVFDVSWNPSHDVQSIFRVYRFGQLKKCYIYRFVAEGTMEEKIYARQVTKLSLEKRVMDEQQIERHYTMGNLQELYAYDPMPKEKWKVPLVPKDIVLAEIIKNKNLIASYLEHDTLLEDKEEEKLTEEERKAAWEDFEKEKFLAECDLNRHPAGEDYDLTHNLRCRHFHPDTLPGPSRPIPYREETDELTVTYVRNTYFRRENNGFINQAPFMAPNPYVGSYRNIH